MKDNSVTINVTNAMRVYNWPTQSYSELFQDTGWRLRSVSNVVNGIGGRFPASTPFSYTAVDHRSCRGSKTDFLFNRFANRKETDFQFWGVSSPWSENRPFPARVTSIEKVKSEALDGLLRNLSNGDMNLGSDAAEAYGSSAESHRRVSSMKNGKFGRNLRLPALTPIGALKVGSNAWLAWQYAIRPAISSAFAAVDFRLKASPEMLICKGSCRKNLKSDIFVLSSSKPGMWTLLSMKETPLVKYKVRYTIDNVLMANLSSVTTMNPLLIAWDLVPLSFVVDWFVNIGGYMEAYEKSLALGLNVIDVTESTLDRYEASKLHGGFWNGSTSTVDAYQTQDMSEVRIESSFSRRVLSSIPRPSPSFYLSGKVDLGSSRLLSAASLLAQFLDWPVSRK